MAHFCAVSKDSVLSSARDLKARIGVILCFFEMILCSWIFFSFETHSESLAMWASERSLDPSAWFVCGMTWHIFSGGSFVVFSCAFWNKFKIISVQMNPPFCSLLLLALHEYRWLSPTFGLVTETIFKLSHSFVLDELFLRFVTLFCSFLDFALYFLWAR